MCVHTHLFRGDYARLALLGWLQQMRHPTMQMQNASPRSTVHALQLLQQVMQKGRQIAFRGERRCKNTLPLSSMANGERTGLATCGGGRACGWTALFASPKCTTYWSSQLLPSVPFTIHTRQSAFCLSKMHISVELSLIISWRGLRFWER